MALNKVMLMGNLTKEVEVKYSENGTAIANFGIAVNEKYGEKEDVLFIDIAVFGKQAESCGQYLVKGQGVVVDGRLKQERWETSDGQKRISYKVYANHVTFLGKPKSAQQEEEVPF